MALIVMAVWDTRDNNRTWCTKATLDSLRETVDWHRHHLVIVDNDSCDATRSLLSKSEFDVITLPENVGQARAINQGLLLREPGEFVVRMDNDVVVHQKDWIEDMEYVVQKDPQVAIVALKRTNAWEHPDNLDESFRSYLEMLPHSDGEQWMVTEVAHSVLGTCQGLTSEFLDRIGFLYQVGSLWGFIDPLLCARAHALGYKTVYIPHVKIDYLDWDTGPDGVPTPYRKWKDEVASEFFPRFEEEKQRILAGGSVYHGPEDP